MHIDNTRRKLLASVAAFRLLPSSVIANYFLNSPILFGQSTNKKYFITVRSVFCLREKNKTNFEGDLKPLAPYQSTIKVAQGMGIISAGDGYHMGSQKRFATSCRPTSSDANIGGGAFNGTSFDIVVGQHQKKILNTKEDFLILGAFPNTRGFFCFEGVSFLNKDQGVRPMFDYDKVMADIKGKVNVCSAQRVRHDVEKLKQENLMMKVISSEYEKLSKDYNGGEKDQLLAMQKKYLDLIKTHDKIISNNGYLEGECFELPAQALPHTYVGNMPFKDVPQHFDPHMRKMNHTAAVALASGYTASVTLNYNFSGHDQPNVPPVHGFTHASFVGRTQAQGNVGLDEFCTFQINMLAHLFAELNALKILQDTAIIYSVHERPTHNVRDNPVIAHGFGNGNVDRPNLKIHDVAKDILQLFNVPNFDKFGGETAKGGILL